MLIGGCREGVQGVLECVAEDSYTDLLYIEDKIVGKSAPQHQLDASQRPAEEIIEGILNYAQHEGEVMRLQKISKAVLMRYLRRKGFPIKDDEKKMSLHVICKKLWCPQTHAVQTEDQLFELLQRVDEEMADEVKTVMDYHAERRSAILQEWRDARPSTSSGEAPPVPSLPQKGSPLLKDLYV